MYKRIISTILAIVMVTLTGTTVMAKDVNANDDIPANMQLVASYTEQLDGDVTVVKKLYLDQSQFARGFSGIRQGTVMHTFHQQGVSGVPLLRVVGDASFMSGSSEDVTVISGSYNSFQYNNTDWYVKSASDKRESNIKPWFGDLYAKYSVQYTASIAYRDQSYEMWIKCDIGGLTDNNTDDKSCVPPNSVQIGDSVISFG